MNTRPMTNAAAKFKVTWQAYDSNLCPVYIKRVYTHEEAQTAAEFIKATQKTAVNIKIAQIAP